MEPFYCNVLSGNLDSSDLQRDRSYLEIKVYAERFPPSYFSKVKISLRRFSHVQNASPHLHRCKTMTVRGNQPYFSTKVSETSPQRTIFSSRNYSLMWWKWTGRASDDSFLNSCCIWLSQPPPQLAISIIYEKKGRFHLHLICSCQQFWQ